MYPMEKTSQTRTPYDQVSVLDVKIPSCVRQGEQVTIVPDEQKMTNSCLETQRVSSYQKTLRRHPFDRKHGLSSLLVVVGPVNVSRHACHRGQSGEVKQSALVRILCAILFTEISNFRYDSASPESVIVVIDIENSIERHRGTRTGFCAGREQAIPGGDITVNEVIVFQVLTAPGDIQNHDQQVPHAERTWLCQCSS